MTTATKQTEHDNAGYLSVRGGKWHRAVVAEPTFMHDEQTACGLTVRPLNVTWNGERPSSRPRCFCKHCERKTEGAQRLTNNQQEPNR